MPCTEATICRPIRSPAAAEHPLRRDETLRPDRLAVAEQEEQGEKTEAEEDHAMERAGAEASPERSVGGGVDPLHDLRREAGMGQVGVPPLGDRRDAEGEVGDEGRDGHARAFHLLAVRKDAHGLARGLDRQDRKGQQDHETDQRRRRERQDVARQPVGDPGLQALVGRPERDGDDERPHQALEVVGKDVQTEQQQAGGEREPGDAVPRPGSGCRRRGGGVGRGRGRRASRPGRRGYMFIGLLFHRHRVRAPTR